MTIRPVLLVAAAFGITLSGPAPQPSFAGPTAEAMQEWSGVKKPRRYRTHARVYYAPRYAAPVGRLGDPSLGPNGLPYRRPYDPGGCIIDEGYGRFSGCSNR